MQKNIEKNNPVSVSEKQSQNLEDQETSTNLPRNVSLQLYKLMKQVVENDVNPETVKAACNCATEIHRMIKLNLELQKLNLEL